MISGIVSSALVESGLEQFKDTTILNVPRSALVQVIKLSMQMGLNEVGLSVEQCADRVSMNFAAGMSTNRKNRSYFCLSVSKKKKNQNMAN